MPANTLAPVDSRGSRITRDDRLDRYLAAHQQFAGSSALGVPSGFLRNAAPTRRIADRMLERPLLALTDGQRPVSVSAGLGRAGGVGSAGGTRRPEVRAWLRCASTRPRASATTRARSSSAPAGNVSSSRIAHYCEGPNQYERIDAIDGQMRQVFRHNDAVVTLWPEPASRCSSSATAGAVPSPCCKGEEGVADHYDLRLTGEERVAGHEAQVLLLQPRDATSLRLAAVGREGQRAAAACRRPGAERRRARDLRLLRAGDERATAARERARPDEEARGLAGAAAHPCADQAWRARDGRCRARSRPGSARSAASSGPWRRPGERGGDGRARCCRRSTPTA